MTRKLIAPVLSVVMLIAALVASIAVAAELENDIAYGRDQQQRLDICHPQANGNASVLLVIHGGNWRLGDKRQDGGLCRLAAERGMLGVRIGYRLANGAPDTIWPAQFDDVQMALQWVRAHSADLKIDPQRVCAYGQSAGGHLAAFLAVRHEVACAIDAFGPVDLTTYNTPVASLFGPGLRDPAAIKREEQAASPLFLAARDTPPIMIIQGTRDARVPPSQSIVFFQALREAGSHPVLITYEGEHAFRGISPAERRAILNRVLEFAIDATRGGAAP